MARFPAMYKGKAERGAAQTIRLLDEIDDALIEGKVVLDLGCNEGLVASYLSRTRAARRVIGFEPHPTAYTKALAASKLAKFEVRQCAVMVHSGEAMLRTNKVDAESNYFCNSSIATELYDPRYVYERISCVSFAGLLTELKPDGIKIDIEGSEWELLLRTAIPRHVKWLCVEVHWLKVVGKYLFPILAQKLRNEGFGITHWPSELRIKDGEPYSFPQHDVVNFVRGAKTSRANLQTLSALRRAGAAAVSGETITRIVYKQKLLNEFYSKRKVH